MKKILFVVYCLIVHKISFSQEGQTDSLTRILLNGIVREGQKLKLGDQVPELEWKMVNYSSPRLRLSDLRGKWVILDFWGNGCSSCISAMPRLHRLQMDFGDKIIILPISYQSAAVSLATLNKVGKLMGADKPLYSIVEDTTTYSLFTSYMNPFEVWIDPTGKLAARTGLDYVTRENIAAAIEGKPIRFSDMSRRTHYDVGDTSMPILSGSMIRQWDEQNHTNDFKLLHPAKDAVHYWTGGSLSYLYFNAYRDMDPAAVRDIEDDGRGIYRRVIANFNYGGTPDSGYLVGSYTPQNQRQGLAYCNYSYESVMPAPADKKMMAKRAIEELDQYFHIRSSIEKRQEPILRLVRLEGFNGRPPTKEEQFDYEVVNNRMTVNYGDLRFYISLLNYFMLDNSLPRIVDETGIKGKIYLPLVLDKKMTLVELRRQLQKHRLDLVPGKREMNMLVLQKEGQVSGRNL